MKYIGLLVVASCLVLSGCSNRAVQNAPAPGRTPEQIELDLIAQAKKAWFVLADPSKKSQWPEATKQYNDALLEIIAKVRYEWKRSGGDIKVRDNAPFAFVRPDFVGGNWTVLYDDAVPCASIKTELHLRERVYVEGVGVPLAGLVKSDIKLVNNKVIKDNGNVHTITGILDFDHLVNGKPSFKAYPRLDIETVKVGSQEHPLAADFTAPIAEFWKRNEVKSASLLGLFRPTRAMEYKGLYFSEPYNSKKIPVIMTHGLMSSPATFANLMNRLLADPVIRHNYQFWFFDYPSGTSWVVPAKDLRDSLDSIYKEYDPKGTAPNMNKIVMVGHSMGGLITRLNTSTKPWTMIYYVAKNQEKVLTYDYKLAEKLVLWDERATARVRDMFVFESSPRVKRIVFMATPHRGSDFANRWFGLLGQRLVRLPEAILTELAHIGTLDMNMFLFNPRRLTEEFTSIGQLSPSSPMIKGVQHVFPRQGIPVHSIIGDQGERNLAKSSDGIVPYYSSHLDWADSEKVVPWTHSVQNSIETAEEMRRILLEHLRAEGMSDEIKKGEEMAPTIWQDNPIKYYYQSRKIPF